MPQEYSIIPHSARKKIADSLRRRDKPASRSLAVQSSDVIEDGVWLQRNAELHGRGLDSVPRDVATPAARAAARRRASRKPSGNDTLVLGKESIRETRYMVYRLRMQRMTIYRPVVKAWSLLREFLRDTGRDTFGVGLLRAAGMSKGEAYLAAAMMQDQRNENNGIICRLPSDSELARKLEMSLDVLLAMDHLCDLTTTAGIEAAVLRGFIEDKPGKHAMSMLCDLIKRSKPTVRLRLALIEGLVVTANWVKLATQSCADLDWALRCNEEGGVYWFVQWRHEWLEEKRSRIMGDYERLWRKARALGYTLVLTRRTVNSYELDPA